MQQPQHVCASLAAAVLTTGAAAANIAVMAINNNFIILIERIKDSSRPRWNATGRCGFIKPL
jgi:hypothetical protein